MGTTRVRSEPTLSFILLTHSRVPTLGQRMCEATLPTVDLGQGTISALTFLICKIGTVQEPPQKVVMRIKCDDTCLAVELVHGKHAVNVIHVANTITNQTIQIPALCGVCQSLASLSHL